MSLDPLTFVRTMEVLLSSTIIILVIIRVILAWTGFSTGQKLIFASWVAYMITATWDIFILILSDRTFSFRVIPFTVGMVCAIAYLLEPSRSYKKRLGQEPMDKEGL